MSDRDEHDRCIQRDNLKCNSLAALENAGTDLLGFISQPSFQITRREAREAVKCMKRTGAALVACIERLEAERDALLAEHEAITMMLPLCGLDWKEEGCDDPCDVCALPPVHAAHDNAERVRRAASS